MWDVRRAAATIRYADMAGKLGPDLGEAYATATQAERLLWTDMPATVRPDMLQAVGWLHQVVGFGAHDAGDELAAANLWRVAEDCARNAGDTSLQARVLQCRARRAIWMGKPARGDALAAKALTLGAGLSPTELAAIIGVRARAVAACGDVNGARVLVKLADQEIGDAAPGDVADKPWWGFYDRHHLNGDTGYALALTLNEAQTGAGDATGRLQNAVRGHGQGAERSRVLACLVLAQADMGHGDPHRGRRIAVEVAKLQDGCRPHQSTLSDVAEVADRCREVLAA
jgi:hypothetical protein